MRQKYAQKRKLLNLGINSDIQFRMIGKIFGILFLSLLLSNSIFFYVSNQEITNSFQMFHIKANNFLDFLFPAIAISFILSLFLGIVASLFFPKAYAGGLYRIQEDLKKVRGGDLTVTIKPRQGDDVQEVTGELNELIEEFRKDFSFIRSSLVENQERFKAMETAESREVIVRNNALVLDRLGKFKLN